MKSKRILAVMLSGFMVLGSMTPVFAEELKSENTNDNALVSEEQQGNDVNSSEEVKTNDEAVITNKDNEDKTAQDEKKAEENTSSNELSKTVKSSSKTSKAVVTGQVDEATGIKFSYDEDTKEATLTNSDNFDPDGKGIVNFTIPSKVKVAGGSEEYVVTKLGAGLFSSGGMGNIEEITVPKTIETIDMMALGEGAKLKTIKFEEGSQLKTIGNYAFSSNMVLENMDPIPKSVETIGEQAFSLCIYLSPFSFEEGSNLKSIGEYAFESVGAASSQEFKELVIPKSVTSVGSQAFSGVANVEKVIFEEGSNLDTISPSMFYQCPKLKDVVFAKSMNLKTIGNAAFGKTAITDIKIPNSVETIGRGAFVECSELASCTFEEMSKVKTIDVSAFQKCVKLKEIVIPKSVETLGGFKGCTSLADITFQAGSKLKTISNQAFMESGIKGIKLPKSVETIGTLAFYDCKDLAIIDTEEGSALTSTASDMISGCENLKTFRITNPNFINNCNNLGKVNDRYDSAKIDGFTIIAHKGSDASKSSLYTYYENNTDGSWVFKTEGVCHGPDEVPSTKVEPTCANAGSITYSAGTCSCGNVVSDEVTVEIPATGNHTFDKTVVDKTATCTEKGKEHKICSVCDDIDYDSYKDIDMIPHTFDKTVVDKAATCTEEGIKHVVCSVCNTKKEGSDETIGVIPHKFDKEVVDKEATYTEEGSKHTECSVCGTKKEGSDVIIPKIVKEDGNNNGSGSTNNNSSNNGDSTSNGSTVTKINNDKTAVNNPKTSDEMNMIIYVIMGLVSLGAVGTV